MPKLMGHLHSLIGIERNDMSEGSQSGNGGSTPLRFRPARHIARVLLLICLAGALWLFVQSARKTLMANSSKESNEQAAVRSTGLIQPAAHGLAAQFTDSQGRLLADPPASADQLLDPQTLVVAHIVGSDPEAPGIPWKQFEAHLALVTGRQVEDQEFDDTPEQLAQIKTGSPTIVALHAADTPFLVNNYGFEPAAVLGDESGANGNHLDIVVPAGSGIQHPGDLRGHSLVCTVPTSITGYRAAIVLLMKNEGLRPNLDYFLTWSMGQKLSITGIAGKEYEAAAISDDKLQSMLQLKQVDSSKYQVIYKSDVIPRTTIGWFYNLKPELAEKVRQGILSYKPDAASAAADAAMGDAADNTDSPDVSGKLLHFIPIEYKKDFQLVRLMDDGFDPRLGAKNKTKAAATTEPATP
jgi:phosphonate transport system substrate-binding protein